MSEQTRVYWAGSIADTRRRFLARRAALPLTCTRTQSQVSGASDTTFMVALHASAPGSTTAPRALESFSPGIAELRSPLSD